MDVKWKIPAFDGEVPEVYEQEEIDVLLGASDARHHAADSTMLKALFREKEVVYLTWGGREAVHPARPVKARVQLACEDAP